MPGGRDQPGTIRRFLGTRRHRRGMTTEAGVEGGEGTREGVSCLCHLQRSADELASEPGPGGGLGNTPGSEGAEKGLRWERTPAQTKARCEDTVVASGEEPGVVAPEGTQAQSRTSKDNGTVRTVGAVLQVCDSLLFLVC